MNTQGDSRLAQLVDSIQKLNSTEYEELFKLLYQNKCEYTQNNNGIFLNLTWLNPKLLEKIELFVQFCKASRRELLHYETICKDLSSGVNSSVRSGTSVVAKVDPQNISSQTNASAAWLNFNRNTSTMKFYLMKKRYAKMVSFDTNLQNDLEKEEYLL